MRKPDLTDCRILEALHENARLSNKELAARVGIAPSTCLERVRRLERGGVLRGARAQIDPSALGIGLQAIVAVRLARHSRDKVESFRIHALGLREVVHLYHMAGANDFLVHVAVRDAEHLRTFALEAFTDRPEVARIETGLIFEHVESAELPLLIDPE